MSNLIRKVFSPTFAKAYYLAHIPSREVGGYPLFTPQEIAWIEKQPLGVEELEFLYMARLDDPDYQILPDDAHRKPLEIVEKSKAMQDCLDFVFKRKGTP